MGNANTTDLKQGTYQSLDDLPNSRGPPSASEIVKTCEELALRHFSKNNPINPTSLRIGVKNQPWTPERKQRFDSVMASLSEYDQETQPYTDRVYTTQSPHPQKLNLMISSNKNADHTISYWVMYPIHDFHIRAAFLKLLDVDITPHNMYKVSEKYKVLFHHVKQLTAHKTVKCEQVDPLYMDNIAKSLTLQGYTFQKAMK